MPNQVMKGTGYGKYGLCKMQITFNYNPVYTLTCTLNTCTLDACSLSAYSLKLGCPVKTSCLVKKC